MAKTIFKKKKELLLQNCIKSYKFAYKYYIWIWLYTSL